MKNFIVQLAGGVLISSFFFSCTNQETPVYEKRQADTTHHQAEEHGHHHHQDANAYMNESEFEELVDRFENPSRNEWQKPEEVIQLLGDLKGKTILDIGAGTGYFSFRFAEKAEKVIAADVDERFLEYMEDKNLNLGKKNMEFRKAEMNNPPILENEADVVILVDVYHHIDRRKTYFSALKKGLKKGGHLFIIDFKKGDLPQGPPNEMKIGPNTVIQEMKEAGFQSELMDTTTLPYQYVLKFGH